MLNIMSFWKEHHTIIFTVLAAMFALIAAVTQYMDNNKVEKDNKLLQQEIVHFTKGGDYVPMVTASIMGDTVWMTMINRDEKYPILNVKAKIRESLLPDIGTIYPGVAVRFADLTIPNGQLTEGYYITVWYNNKNAVVITVNLTKDNHGQINATVTYLNQNDEPFVPSWPPASQRPNTFNSRLHSHI